MRIISCLLLCFSLFADYGLDTLAMAKYPKRVAKDLPNGWWFGTFAETFGDAYPAVERVLKTGKPKGYRIQLLWSDSHNFGDSDIPKIISLSKKYNQLAVKYPNIKCEISPFCEHKLQNIDKYLDIAAKHAPNCTIVNTVWTGALSKKYKNEVHGNKKAAPKGRYNFSYDGQSAVDANVEADKTKYKLSEVFYFWIPQFNLRAKMDDPTPRPERKIRPDAKQMKSVIYLANPKGKTNFPKSVTYKSHADQHNMPREFRASKPVVIYSKKCTELQFTKNNKRMGRLIYGGPFSGGGHIYRHLENFGYELADRSIKEFNDSILTIIGCAGKIGTVNPAFRDGNFR